MSDAKLTFDADTSAYNAKMAEAGRHTKGLVETIKEGAEPLLKIATIAGAIELAIEGVKSRWEEWRRQIELAEQANKRLGTDLAATVGAAGLISSFPQIRKAVAESQGPLSIEQRTQAIGSLAGALPGLTDKQAIAGVGQAQQAAHVVGPENIANYMQAVGLGMQSGLSQKVAGDVAIAVAQSGTHGIEAYQRAAGRFADDYNTPEARQKADFLKFVQNAGSDVFGSRPAQILGGQALQRQLKGNVDGLLERQAEIAERDPVLRRQREVQTTEAGTEAVRQGQYGSRADLEREFEAAAERRRARGNSTLGVKWARSDAGLRDTTEQLTLEETLTQSRAGSRSEVSQGRVNRPDAGRLYAEGVAEREGLSPVGSGRARFDRRRDEVLEEMRQIRLNTHKAQGAERFRNEAQDRDPSGER